MILLAVACLIFVSCGTKKEKATEASAETCCTAEQQEMFANWENWADLDAEQQVALVGEMKAFLDDCKAKCEAKCHDEGKVAEEPKEECPEKAAQYAEFKAKWEAFNEQTLEEQKALIDQVLECQKACKEKKEGCCKKDHEGCEKDKKHEGCAHE